jgi:cholesterol oxidase
MRKHHRRHRTTSEESLTTPTGLSFTEQMRGHLALDETDPAAGDAGDPPLTVHLTISIDDVAAFVEGPSHLADVEGWVDCDALGGRLTVVRGSFELFAGSEERGARRMHYHLHLDDGHGNPRTLSGRKEIRDDPGLDLWTDTTTLYTRMYRGYVEIGEEHSARILGAGMLRLGAADLVRQLGTFTTTGPNGSAALLQFGRFFLGELWEVYARSWPNGPGR